MSSKRMKASSCDDEPTATREEADVESNKPPLFASSYSSENDNVGLDLDVEVKDDEKNADNNIKENSNINASIKDNNNSGQYKQKKQQQQQQQKKEHSVKLSQKRSQEYSEREHVVLPRLVARNLPYDQSASCIRIENFFESKTKFSSRMEILNLLKSDWFHIILRWPLYVSLFSLLTIWAISILIFASFYVAIDNINPDVSCGLGNAGSPILFPGAFAFSLETCTTVGYGLPSSVNSFFNDGCESLQIVMFLQMIWSMMFNAFLFAFFYAQLAKVDARGAQVVFSNKAIVSIHTNPSHPELHPQVRFQIRVYDVDSRLPLIESHVRLYAISKDRPVPRQLRLMQPDDDVNNGMLFLSMPNVICHHIDLYSMLHPPPPPVPTNENETNEDIILPYITSSNGFLPTLRQIESWTGSRDEVVCPICGESYGTVERWIQHVKNFQKQEEVAKYPKPGTHRTITKEAFQYALNYLKPTTDLEAIQRYFEEEISEIIVVVDAIEPTSSGTFSSLQSYCIDDIIFDATAAFRPCVSVEPRKNKEEDLMVVDLDRFHGIDYNVFPDPSVRQSGRYNNKNDHAISGTLDQLADDVARPASPRTHFRKNRLPQHSFRYQDKMFK